MSSSKPPGYSFDVFSYYDPIFKELAFMTEGQKTAVIEHF